MAGTTLHIRRYHREDQAAVDRLNQRLAAGGVTHPFFAEGPTEADAASPFRSRLFVAANGTEVRGGVWLSEQDFWVNGAAIRAGWARYPLAESLVNPAFGGVPGSLLLHLLREQPRLMALGLGGHRGPFARLLGKMGWAGLLVPLFFLAARPARVLRRLPYLRRTPVRRLVLDLLTLSGAGWAGLHAARLATRLLARGRPAGYTADLVEEFEPWADAVWERVRDAYAFVACRDSATLRIRYPRGYRTVTRLRVRRSGEDVGWACVVEPDRRSPATDVYVGDVATGFLADGLALPEDAAGVTAAATEYLLETGVELVLSNQAHPAWQNGLRASGYLSGPSNFAFYRSPQMERVIGAALAAPRGFHLNRGDCDGPGQP